MVKICMIWKQSECIWGWGITWQLSSRDVLNLILEELGFLLFELQHCSTVIAVFSQKGADFLNKSLKVERGPHLLCELTFILFEILPHFIKPRLYYILQQRRWSFFHRITYYWAVFDFSSKMVLTSQFHEFWNKQMCSLSRKKNTNDPCFCWFMWPSPSPKAGKNVIPA